MGTKLCSPVLSVLFLLFVCYAPSVFIRRRGGRGGRGGGEGEGGACFWIVYRMLKQTRSQMKYEAEDLEYDCNRIRGLVFCYVDLKVHTF